MEYLLLLPRTSNTWRVTSHTIYKTITTSMHTYHQETDQWEPLQNSGQTLASTISASNSSFLLSQSIYYYGDVRSGWSAHPYLNTLGIPKSQHLTHTRHKYGWSKRTTHRKWDSEEDNLRYTQHQKTDRNMTDNLYRKSVTQLFQPSSDQNYHHVMQPQ